MDGRRDACCVMAHGKYLYVGHFWSGGVSILDISDPKHPKPVTYIPCPRNTWNTNIQVADDLLLVADELKLHIAPELRFVYDDSLDKSFTIEDAIKNIKSDSEQGQETPGDEPGDE